MVYKLFIVFVELLCLEGEVGVGENLEQQRKDSPRMRFLNNKTVKKTLCDLFMKSIIIDISVDKKDEVGEVESYLVWISEVVQNSIKSRFS